MEIQNSRGTLRPIDHSLRLMKGRLDMASLHFLQGAQTGGWLDLLSGALIC